MSVTMPSNPVHYQPSVEQIAPDEGETRRGLEQTFRNILEATSKDYGHAVRSVHAKAHGLVRGTLTVADGLPSMLAQGLFSRPGDHDVVLRFSTNAGDILEDSISLPRGVAIKVLDVPGERLEGAEDADTQDFIMVNSPAFSAPNPKKFLANLKMLAKTTDKGEGMKSALSAVLRTTESALEAVGTKSATLQTLGGAPQVHPLGETYYTQTPFRYGDYIAKLSLAPVSSNLTALTGRKVDASNRPDALREVIHEAFAGEGGTFELRVQLCSDLDAMPVEDASAVWDEEKSPYVTVATLKVPAQESWQGEESVEKEDRLAFSPWHGLAAHQPLGGVNRMRQATYAMSATFRSSFNHCPIHEPPAREDMPAG